MKMIKKTSFFLILLLLILPKSYSQTITLTSQSKIPLNITSEMEVFKDSTSKVPFEQLSQHKFTKHLKKYFIFPYSDNAYWIKYTFKNEDSEFKKWIIKWNNPLTEQLEFYVLDSTGRKIDYQKQRLLTTQKTKKFLEEEITFKLDLPTNSTKTVYLRLKNQRGIYGAVILHSAPSYVFSNIDIYADQSFNLALIIFRFFLVIVLGLFIIKDRIFRAYSIQIAIRTFSFLGMMNVPGPLFSSNPDIAQKIDFLCYNSFAIGSGILILAVLEIEKLPKWMVLLIKISIASTAIINVLVLFDYKWYWLKAGHYNIVSSSAIVLTAYIYSLIKRYNVHIYYSFPFILGVIANFIFNLRLFGLLEFKPIFEITTFLFIAEIFLFVVFLGQIFRSVELNKMLAEEKLQFNVVQNERLKELDNLKTNFFTNISHEFRTPLSLILSPIEDLKKKYPNEAVLEPMRRNAQRLLSLINQLLDLSKLDSGQMQVNIRKNDLANFIKVLASSFTSLAESRTIEFTITQNRLEAIAYYDADKIEKILINLLSNAFKFTANGGKITLVVNYTDDFREVEICVKDNGIGISPNKIKHIFDRFYQVDGTQQRNYEGSGIGLALVKEMVELHKGTIDVESIESEGTTFTVKLRVDKNSWENELKNDIEETNNEKQFDFMLVAQPQQTMIMEHSLTDDEKILLIVEDNPDLRQYIRSVFEQDYRIFEAIDGQEGIEKALEIIPDVVISDLMMPRLDGLGLCKLLKSDEKTSHVPVVMLTAKANVESRIEGFELGADDYLTKPFNKEELLVRVRNLINQRAILRQKYNKQIVDLKPTEVILPSIDEKFINKAKEIVEKYISESEFNIEQFAEEMNLTSVVLRRKIKAVTNQSATQFVRKYRLQKAANLLQNNADTVSNIAYEVGFESLSYFTKVFQEEFGKLPSEYGK
ncbi:MAG: ATP-binding protein [Emticicia sp.]|nr:ATP-binding protein [Emticicia sp.]